MYDSWGALMNSANSQAATPGSYDLTPQYGANGTQDLFALPTQTNPYDSIISQGQNMMSNDASVAGAQSTQANAAMNAQNQGLQSYQAQSAYPSYPNAAGAGSQTAGQVNTSNGYDMSTADTSHGFNPWSLTGEALTRKTS